MPNTKGQQGQYGLGSKGLNVCHNVAKHSASILVLDNQSALHMSHRKSLVEFCRLRATRLWLKVRT